MMNSRTLMIFGYVLAGLCLVRVISVAAATDDDVEVYSATEDSSSGDDSRSSARDKGAEIRISRPDEAESRIAHDEESFPLVRGVERLRRAEVAENTLVVPRRTGRVIASEPSLHQTEAASPNPTRGRLATDPIEPRPFTAAEANARASELHGENLVASNSHSGRPALGLPGEPGPETRIDPPMPASASIARAGVQEVSVIVSDYGYFPNRIFVTQNVPVKIYLTTPSKVTMCFMLDNWGLKKGILPGKVEELSFVPDVPGNYRFYCPVKSIEGMLTVREAPVAVPSSRGVASEAPEPEEPKAAFNEPKRAAQLRALIED